MDEHPTRATIERLARRARRVVAEADADTRRLAAAHLADTVGCAIAGSDHPTLERLLRATAATSGHAGHHPLAATEVDTDLPTAVAIDAVAAHVDEHDAVHPGSGTVPVGIAAPAAIAVGRHVRASGRQVLEALVAGVEVMVEAGRHVGGSSLYRRGWWPSLVVGPLGAAATVAHLLDLDVDRTAQALALATTGAGGLLTSDVFADGHYWSFGEAAARGVRAAVAAQHGLTASAGLLDGPTSVAFGPAADPTPDDGPPHLLGCVAKASPSSMPFQPVAQALRELRDQRGADTIHEVRVTIPAALLPFVSAETEVAGPPEAAASLAYVVAASLGPPGDDLDVFRRHDPDETRGRRVVLRGSELALGPPGSLAAHLEVVGHDGASEPVEATFVPPSAADPAKYARNVARVGRTHPRFEDLLELDHVDDVTEVLVTDRVRGGER